mgnify:CR=1 FL=1
MAIIKDIEKLAADIWKHVAMHPEDLPSLAQAESSIRAGNMSLEEAQSHEHSDILVEE